MKKKILALTLVFALALALGIGGTVAWLTAQTTPVVNTFTVGDINITLAETTTDFKMVPGNEIAKDPKVTVLKDSEACWLFVKIVKSNNYSTYLEDYQLAAGWTALAGVDGVYYREVSQNASNDTEYYVLSAGTKTGTANGHVKVKEAVTKAQMEAIKDANRPTLTFTAYAVQKDNIATAADAWAKVSTTSNP